MSKGNQQDGNPIGQGKRHQDQGHYAENDIP